MTKHQYGFWLEDGRRYVEPMYGLVNGRRLKGSDFVFQSLWRSGQREPAIYNMERQSRMSDGQIFDVFSDDDGKCPLPMFETHCEIWRGYARDMLSKGLTPSRLVEACRRDPHPVRALLVVLRRIAGYGEDPLAKKAALLAVMLANRPEGFLLPEGFQRPSDLFPPIVDYHIQRSALRTGLVRIDDEDLRGKVAARAVLSAAEESVIRNAVYGAMEELARVSGKGIDALDWFFFQNRRRCPEMTEPECPRCEIQSVCARRTELFQPVFRTTYY